MNVHQTEAFALKTYPFEESHRIVVFLSREFGRLRGIAHGAKKNRSRFGSSLELLTHSRVVFYRKENQELAVIQSCEILHAYPSYRLSWELNLHFNYFAELLLEFSREQQEAERLCRLTLAVLEASSSVPIVSLARYFELWILKLEGVLPDLDTSLPPALAEAARSTMRLHPRDLPALASDLAAPLERACQEWIEAHLEKPLRSRSLLKDLL
jgi:DNA repair protein RecO (recombination protein O)